MPWNAPWPPGPPGLRCLRCARTQPPLPRGVRTCVYCSAPLPVQRWRADPPPNLHPTGRAARAPRRRRVYFGPPSYGAAHPRWGFPATVWRGAGHDDPQAGTVVPLGRLRLAAALCWATGAAALAAAGGEIWRFVLLLRGRTEVLSGPVVVASDRFLTIAAVLAALLAVAAVVVLVPALVGLHSAAARLGGLEPSRLPAAVLARLVVPGWNLSGLGVVAGEIDGSLSSPGAAGRPRMSRLVLAWWIAWVFNGVLALVALGRAFGTSDQAVADTVELHIFVDLAGAAVAVLAALVCRRFLRLVNGVDPGGYDGWVVRAPEPTRTVGTAPGGDRAVLHAPPPSR